MNNIYALYLASPNESFSAYLHCLYYCLELEPNLPYIDLTSFTKQDLIYESQILFFNIKQTMPISI